MAEEGEYTIEETIARLDNGHGTEEVTAPALAHPPAAPISGAAPADRAADHRPACPGLLFPLAKGGATAIPERSGPEKRSPSIASPSGRMPR